MSQGKRRSIAKGILLVYVIVASTFELAHTDYIPLQGKIVLGSVDAGAHSLASRNDELACPAHQFAQSTHCTGIKLQQFSSSSDFTYAWIDSYSNFVSAPLHITATRGPPQA